MFSNFNSSAPGKIILAGEHSVVHGTRALATVVDKRSYAKFTTAPLPLPITTSTSTSIIEPNPCDISLTIAYPGYTLIHQWQNDDLLKHRSTLIHRYMTDIIDYTPCDHDHDTADGSNDPAPHDATHNHKPYFTTEDKFMDYVQDHTYPNRHLLHKHHATLDKTTDIFDKLYSEINVKVIKYCQQSEQFSRVDPTTLHSSHEVCPAKVFLLFHFLLLLTSSQVMKHGEETKRFPQLHCQITSDLPMGSGLGSSASVSSALATGFYQILRNYPNTIKSTETPPQTNFTLTASDLRVINTWAFQGERVIHGTPSGVDNTCTVYGGVIAFRRVNGEAQMDFLPAGAIPSTIQILITNTKQPKNTKALVAGVHALKKSYEPVISPIFSSIEAITTVLLNCIRDYINRESTFSTDDDVFATMRDVLRINQQLLNALGVGHAKIDEVVKISDQFDGQFTTKLTGAGGGGCVITLTNPKIPKEVLDSFATAIEGINMEVITTVMGQGGAMVTPL